jgi:predicted dehydrogenase
VRAAVVGMGPIGRLHAAAYRDNARTELVAVCDIVAERAERAAQLLGVRAYMSVDEMLATERSLDIVSVATAGHENGSDHYEPTMALIKAGVAVLGEKPISNSLEEAREMAQMAKKLGVRYAIDFNHRFTPCVQQAKSWINDGRIGDVVMVQTRMWIDNSNESAPWFHLRSLHPHSFDLLRFFGGDIAEVGAFAAKGKGRSTWSNVEVIVRYKTGAIGSLAGSYDAGPSWRRDFADILGSEGRIVIVDGYESVSLYRRNSSEVETYRNLGGMRTFPETFPARIGRFIEQVESGVDPSAIEGSALDGVAAQAAIEASIKSACARCFVSVDSV